jgi:peptidoglycan-associated lipoprotein
MKLANTAQWLTVALLALTLGSTGCKKDLQKTTHIPGTGPVPITDDSLGKPKGEVPTGGPGLPPGGGVITIPPATGGPITGGPVTGGPVTGGPVTGTTAEGIKAAIGEWDKWKADAEIFKDFTVYFDFDKAVVKPNQVDKLKQVASRMKGMPDKAVRIEGHCDERGTEEYNRALGDRRAQAIREFLAKEGVNPQMMPTITYGEDKPVDPGHNEEAWKKNRRGELILLTP